MAKTARNIFLVLFILSALFSFATWIVSSAARSAAPAVSQTPGPNGEIVENPQPANESNQVAILTSLATSLASLIGLVATTAIAWRKEKRESALAEAERKKIELEIEKSKWELEELKKEKRK